MNYCLFEKQKSVGEIGEKEFLQYFDSNLIKDVRDIEEYQNKDIDFIVNGFTVELKSSKNISNYNSITIELISNKEKNKKGWFITSQAEIFCFFDLENKIIYGCKSEDLRKWYRENIDDIKTLEYKSREYKTAKEKISLLAFIPLDRMEREIKSFRKWSVK